MPDALERDRGAPIDFERLTRGERTLYALPPIEPLPDSFPAVARNYHGPHYVVPFYDASGQALLVVVAAHSPMRADASARRRQDRDRGHGLCRSRSCLQPSR